MKEAMKNYTIISSFSTPKDVDTNSKILIPTTFFIESEVLDSNEHTNEVWNSKLSNLNLTDYHLFLIKPESENQDIENMFVDPHENITFSIIKHNIFFSEGFLDTFYTNYYSNWEQNSHYIIIFLDTNWESVIESFSKCNITIQDVDKYRHIISPMQTRLSIFLFCLFGRKYLDSTLGIDSFPKIHDFKP